VNGFLPQRHKGTKKSQREEKEKNHFVNLCVFVAIYIFTTKAQRPRRKHEEEIKKTFVNLGDLES
jgi:hypothetical protein